LILNHTKEMLLIANCKFILTIF